MDFYKKFFDKHIGKGNSNKGGRVKPVVLDLEKDRFFLAKIKPNGTVEITSSALTDEEKGKIVTTLNTIATIEDKNKKEKK